MNAWAFATKLPYQTVSKRYFSYSFILHAFLISFVLVYELEKIPQKETITFEIISSTSQAPSALAAAPKVDTAATVPTTPVKQSTKTLTLPTKAHQSKTAPVIKSKVVTQTRPVQAKAKLTQAPPVVTVPETLDDIPSPSLEEPLTQATTVPVSDFSDDLGKDFSAIDQKSAEKIQKEKASLKALSEQSAQEHLSEIDQLSDQLNRENKDLTLAAKNALQKQQASQVGPNHQGISENIKAQGLGNSPSAAGAGTQDGNIRALSELKQVPGNPKPEYSNQERLRGDQGIVVFFAYINKDGSTSNFKLVQGSGYRNLDLKTLKALKQWRFYPGQEGWVELPFRWDLQGGPKEMPTLLRRSASR